MSPDFQTVLLIRLALGTMAALYFWALSRRHPSVSGPGWWSAAIACAAIPGTALWMHLPEGIPALLTNLLTTLGVGLAWLGLRGYLGLRLPLRTAVWGFIAYGALNVAFFFGWPSSAPRMVLFFCAQALLASLTLRDIFQMGQQRHQRELRLLSGFTVLEVLGLLAAVAYIATSVESLDPLEVERALPGALAGFLVLVLARTLIYTALVTERLQRDGDRSRQALVQRGTDSRALIEHLSAGVVVFRPDQTIARINSAARRFLGWSDGGANPALPEPLGPAWRLLREDGSGMRRHEMPFERVLATGQPVSNLIMGMPIADGRETRWALCTAYPENDAQGGLLHVVLTFVDISSLRQAQVQQRQLQTQLAQSQKMEALGTLAGGVAHDFNNILAAILGNAELARQDMAPADPARESLHEISTAARRGRELVRQILAYSRQQPMERRPVNLALVLSESCNLLRVAIPPQVELVFPADLRPYFILADATQLGQVLLNLGTNAVHAFDGGSGRVEVRLDAMPEGDRRIPPALQMQGGHGAVRIEVQDNGCGMDEATRERIFEPFFTTRPVGAGTGLGLPVVLGIVQTLGGLIDLKTQPGEGTTFTLWFSAVAADTATEPPDFRTDEPFASAVPGHAVKALTGHSAIRLEPAGTIVHTSTQRQPAPLPEALSAEPPHMADLVDSPNRHILYLDDDDTLVFLVRRLLERRGYRVTTMLNQQDVIDAVRDNPTGFDLLLTDFNMPGMSGLEVAKAVLAINPALPVAVASGYITDELQADALAAGVREVVFKTDAVEDFCAMVERLVGGVDRAQKPPPAPQD
jgi:signal transduction histidine kinase/ActR/RegA family two-component response regulator